MPIDSEVEQQLLAAGVAKLSLEAVQSALSTVNPELVSYFYQHFRREGARVKPQDLARWLDHHRPDYYPAAAVDLPAAGLPLAAPLAANPTTASVRLHYIAACAMVAASSAPMADLTQAISDNPQTFASAYLPAEFTSVATAQLLEATSGVPQMQQALMAGLRLAAEDDTFICWQDGTNPDRHSHFDQAKGSRLAERIADPQRLGQAIEFYPRTADATANTTLAELRVDLIAGAIDNGKDSGKNWLNDRLIAAAKDLANAPKPLQRRRIFGLANLIPRRVTQRVDEAALAGWSAGEQARLSDKHPYKYWRALSKGAVGQAEPGVTTASLLAGWLGARRPSTLTQLLSDDVSVTWLTKAPGVPLALQAIASRLILVSHATSHDDQAGWDARALGGQLQKLAGNGIDLDLVGLHVAPSADRGMRLSECTAIVGVPSASKNTAIIDSDVVPLHGELFSYRRLPELGKAMADMAAKHPETLVAVELPASGTAGHGFAGPRSPAIVNSIRPFEPRTSLNLLTSRQRCERLAGDRYRPQNLALLVVMPPQEAASFWAAVGKPPFPLAEHRAERGHRLTPELAAHCFSEFLSSSPPARRGRRAT